MHVYTRQKLILPEVFSMQTCPYNRIPAFQKLPCLFNVIIKNISSRRLDAIGGGRLKNIEACREVILLKFFSMYILTQSESLYRISRNFISIYVYSYIWSIRHNVWSIRRTLDKSRKNTGAITATYTPANTVIELQRPRGTPII